MPKISLRPPITIVVTLEGLATSPLGCYGCSWNETPAIDALAARGVVWDRWTSPIDRSGGLISRWLRDSRDSLRRYAEAGGAVFVTDDPKLSVPDENAGFDHSVVLKPALKRLPSETIDDTALAQTFAAAMHAAEPKTRLIWIHSGVLRDHWDAPAVNEDIVETDTEPKEDSEPDVSGGVSGGGSSGVPEPVRLPTSTDPPAYSVSRDDDPDRLFLWMNRYAAQVRLLDQMIEMMLDSLASRKPTFVLAGASGFSLGENGWVGHHVGPLRSQDIRLPMLVSRGGPLRVPTMESAFELSAMLTELAPARPGDRRGEAGTIVSPRQWCKIQDPFNPSIQTQSDRAPKAISTPTWFYVCDSAESGDEKLFLKPDDVTDFNDVSRLRREVLDRFAGEATE